MPVIVVSFKSELNYFWEIFKQSSNIKSNENSSSGNRIVLCGQTDRNDETNSRFFLNFEKTIKMNRFFVMFVPAAWSSDNRKTPSHGTVSLPVTTRNTY